MSTTIIAIAGASASGKTYLAQALKQHLEAYFPELSIGLVGEDSYYRNLDHLPLAEREQVNYDHPDALEHELLLSHLQTLKSGQQVEVPTYDYTVHTRAPETRTQAPSHILILEGILLLSNPGLRGILDLGLYVQTPLDVCLARRLRRDVEERGRSSDSVVSQFETTVKPMFHQFIEPSQTHADLTVSGEEKPEVLVQQVSDVLSQHGHLPSQPNEQGRLA